MQLIYAKSYKISTSDPFLDESRPKLVPGLTNSNIL